MKYGIFKFTAKKNEHKNAMLFGIYQRCLIENSKLPASMIALGSVSGISDNRKDPTLINSLNAWRSYQRDQEKTSRSHLFTTKYYIHACDDFGYLCPSKAELKEALMAFANPEELNAYAKQLLANIKSEIEE